MFIFTVSIMVLSFIFSFCPRQFYCLKLEQAKCEPEIWDLAFLDPNFELLELHPPLSDVLLIPLWFEYSGLEYSAPQPEQ